MLWTVGEQSRERHWTLAQAGQRLVMDVDRGAGCGHQESMHHKSYAGCQPATDSEGSAARRDGFWRTVTQITKTGLGLVQRHGSVDRESHARSRISWQQATMLLLKKVCATIPPRRLDGSGAWAGGTGPTASTTREPAGTSRGGLDCLQHWRVFGSVRGGGCVSLGRKLANGLDVGVCG